MMVPSWVVSSQVQRSFFDRLWSSPGVAPKVSAVLWKLSQKDLPNSDRWNGLLELFDKGVCTRCNVGSVHSNAHLFAECPFVQQVWRGFLTWYNRLGLGRLQENSCELLLFGVVNAEGAAPTTQQWWMVAWSAIIFEIWKAWTQSVYGEEADSSVGEILGHAWAKTVLSGAALQQKRRQKFKRKDWEAGGFLIPGVDR